MAQSLHLDESEPDSLLGMAKDNADFSATYGLNAPRYDRLRQEVEFILAAAIARHDIKVHAILGRVKTLDSCLDKIERKGIDPSEAILQDVVGARVVSLFLSDLPRIDLMLRDVFEVVEVDDKVEGGDAASFGYMSVHYICRLRDDYAGERYDEIKGIPFEVQSRTVVMDAWANVSHYLAYKGSASVPDELQRDFNALSGLFYVADQHFELFFGAALKSRQQAKEDAVSTGGPDMRGTPINLDTVLAYLAERFPDREHARAEAISDFVEELARFTTFESIADLDEWVGKGEKQALQDELTSPPMVTRTMTRGRYADVGMARGALDASYPGWEENRKPPGMPTRRTSKSTA